MFWLVSIMYSYSKELIGKTRNESTGHTEPNITLFSSSPTSQERPMASHLTRILDSGKKLEEAHPGTTCNLHTERPEPARNLLVARQTSGHMFTPSCNGVLEKGKMVQGFY